MPTDRISPSPSSSLIETMRLLARDRSPGTSRSAGTAAFESTKNGAGSPIQVRQSAELKRRLHELASKVNLDSPSSVAEMRAPILREILLWEFGSDFRQDSQFLPMVESISQAFDTEPRFQQQFVDMLAGLKKG